MTINTYIRSILLGALIALALGGFMLHSRIHPIAQNPSFLVPFCAGILSSVVVPLLFLFPRTIPYGYVLNGFLAIIGTIAMAHFSLVHWPAPATLQTILLKTLLADILILWGKFFVGKALFDLATFGYDENRQKAGITYRYPNMGWWMIHLVGVSLVYYLGNHFWR
ncbi:MAG: hypothetical protein Q8K00_10640 [Syntrophales bacterium]|nr:hypothetical protein [Syntrophales bacterium]